MNYIIIIPNYLFLSTSMFSIELYILYYVYYYFVSHAWMYVLKYRDTEIKQSFLNSLKFYINIFILETIYWQQKAVRKI